MRATFEAAVVHATCGVYVNLMPDDEQESVKAAYGPNYDRLVALKKTYDSGTLLRMNQGIRPAA